MEKRIGNPNAVFVSKMVAPALLAFAGAVTLIGSGRPVILFFSGPLLLLATFLASAAQIRPERDRLRYRRFLKWEELPYSAIVRCEVGAWPGVGFLKLRRFLPPWGKLYFVIETHDGWPPRGTQLAEFINAKAQGAFVTPEVPSLTAPTRTLKQDRVRCLWAFVGGIAIGLLTAATSHSLVPAGIPQPPTVAFLRHSMEWPWSLLTASLLALGVLVLRFRKVAWVLALGLGNLLGAVVVRAWLCR
jgi:hypothetical protein